MRVIAGTWRGRRLDAPTWEGLRPTSDRLRETLFNILAPRVPGARLADVCAGTGAVGIEALSRGAAWVTFVEQDRRALALIEANLHRCQVTEGYTIDRRDALASAAPYRGGPFDIVFLDPPYAQRSLDAWLHAAAASVAADGVVILEHATLVPPPVQAAGLTRTRLVVQGDSSIAFYAPMAEEA
jgi:16S rRNA (guanine(966)-N(2))-methyltransferase RsmD